MGSVFLSLINISITAGYIVLAALFLRLLLKKAPKWIRGVIWSIVGVRLAVPVSVESIFSLIPSKETIISSSNSGVLSVSSGFSTVDSIADSIIHQVTAQGEVSDISTGELLLNIGSYIWIIGLFTMLLYAVLSTMKINRKLQEAVVIDEKIYACDYVHSPFILGLFKPKIYIPSNLSAKESENIIAHERAHLKRHDNVWKPLAFALLCVYWFNPLCWVAYVLFCKDIELACDEKVIKNFDKNQIADYSETLLRFAVSRKMITACPVAFGENGTKGRIKFMLNYKKPAFWVIIVAVVLCIVTAVCLLTNPVTDETKGTTYLSDSDSKIVLSMTELSDKKITINLKNKSGEDFSIGEAYCIYKVLENEKEEKLESKQDVIVHDLLHIIKDKGTYDLNYDISMYKFEDGQTYKIYLGDFEPTEHFISFVFNSGSMSALPIIEGTYFYIKSEEPSAFTIEFKNDGTFKLYEAAGIVSSYLGIGHYSINGDILTIVEDEAGSSGNVNKFRIKNGKLEFIEEGSDNFYHYKLKNGELFVPEPDEIVENTTDKATTKTETTIAPTTTTHTTTAPTAPATTKTDTTVKPTTEPDSSVYVESMKCKVTEINGTHLVVENSNGVLYQFDYGNLEGANNKHFKVGDLVNVEFKYPIVEVYPNKITNLVNVSTIKTTTTAPTTEQAATKFDSSVYVVSIAKSREDKDLVNGIVLSKKDAASIRKVISSKGNNGWVNSVSNCAASCYILFESENEKFIYRYNESGVIDDNKNNRSLSLSDTNRDIVNSIFSKYLDLSLY